MNNTSLELEIASRKQNTPCTEKAFARGQHL